LNLDGKLGLKSQIKQVKSEGKIQQFFSFLVIPQGWKNRPKKQLFLSGFQGLKR